MSFGLPDHVLRAIIEELRKRKNVARAVVFGSRARGDYRYNSDIDLAIYSEKRVPADLRLDLDRAAGIYKIDVIDMNGPLDDSLRLKVEEQGVEIYRQERGQ